jgi:hypothetical protein
MNDRDMTGDERRDFEEHTVHQDGATPDAGPASDPYSPSARGNALGSKSEAGPSGQRRRTRSRAPGGGVVASDFDPTSRGDEHGEVM